MSTLKGLFNADYLIYQVGLNVKAKSNDQNYDNFRGPDFATVINDALTERAAVGGKYQLLNSFNLTDTISIPDLANKGFWLDGLGAHETILTGATGLAGKMIQGQRAAWGSPQYATFLKVTNLGFNPNNLGTGVIINEYGGIYLDDLYIIPNVPSGNKIIGRIGGSGGPGNPNYIGTIEMRYIGGVRANTLFDIWVDNILIDNIQASVQLAGGSFIYFPGGVSHRINKLLFFDDNATGATTGSVVRGNTLDIGYLQTVVSTTNHPTITGIFRVINSAGRITCSRLGVGDPNHGVYYDDTAKQCVQLGQFGGIKEVTGGSITAHTSGTVYQLFEGVSSSNAAEVNRAIRVTKPFYLLELSGYVQTAPGGADTKVFTLMKNGGATTCTFTLTGAEVSGYDDSHPIEFIVGDTISVRVVGSATAASTSLTTTKALVNNLYWT